MKNISNLEELLDYGEEYQYPDLIMSDYFIIDNTRKKENKNQQKTNKQTQEEISLPHSRTFIFSAGFA